MRAEATIVLATYGRPQHLRECLDCLARLDGGPWPVVVVDDGSPEPVAPLCAERGGHVRCVRQSNAGPAAARNRGLAECETRLVLFTDDDCRPHGDWALRMVEAQAGVANRLVGGRVVNALPRNAFSGASQAILTYSYSAFADFDDPLAFFTTNNFCADRTWLMALGGLDTLYDFASEDRDLSFRWKQAGGHLLHAPQAVVDHHHHLGPRQFLRQHYRYGRGARRFHRRVAEDGAEPVKLGRADFYSGLLLHPLRRPTPAAFLRSGLIALAHAALAAGYATEMRDERRRSSRSG